MFIANMKVKPCHVFPVLSMIAWITFGPMIDDVGPSIRTNRRTASPPHTNQSPEVREGVSDPKDRKFEGCTYHKIEPKWGQLGHHRLRV
jgi:hypothetical protein